MAHLDKVTGRRDCKTFSLALVYHLVSICPRVLEYAVDMFLIPFVLSNCTMVSGEQELRGNPLHFPNSHSLLVTLWPLCFPVLFQVVCPQSFFLCQHVARVLLTRTDLDTHADSSLAQVDRIESHDLSTLLSGFPVVLASSVDLRPVASGTARAQWSETQRLIVMHVLASFSAFHMPSTSPQESF